MSDRSIFGPHSKLIKSVLLGLLVGLAILGYHFYEYLKQAKKAEEHGGATDEEILKLSRRLFAEEYQRHTYLAGIHFQGKTKAFKRDDQAAGELLHVQRELLAQQPDSTFALLSRLFDNYELDSSVVETVTSEEKQEELDFLNAILKTNIMKHTMDFLHQKGFVESGHEAKLELLKRLWFLPYSRGRGRVGSSGFEHVFMAEIKDQNILGLHNWIYFSEQEQLGNLDYKGYIDRLDLGKGDQHLVAVRFTFHDVVKPYNSLLIGTSPELEMSLYTVCFLLRTDETCEVEAFGHRFNIVTHKWDWKGVQTIATAYPSIQ